MKAVEIKIHNFRSIKDVSIELSPFALVVGPNNAGKSNMLAALRVFYEKLKYDEERDWPRFTTDDEECWLELQFKPTPAEWEDLKEEYRLPDGTFRVRKCLKSKETDDEGKPRTGIYAYVEGRLSGGRFYGVKNVQQGKLGDVVFIPAVSHLDEHTKLTGPSPLRDLLHVVLRGVLSQSEAYKDLNERFSAFAQTFKDESTNEGLSLATLEKQLAELAPGWGLRVEFSLGLLSADELIKTLVSHKVFDEDLGASLDPDAYGAGYQRQIIFALVCLAAQYQPVRAAAKKKEFSPALSWIIFEEPEAFLHPPQIDRLHRSLRAYASSDGQQVTVSSHSPRFASRRAEDIAGVARLHRCKGVTEVGQVRAADLQSLLSSNQAMIEDLKRVGAQIEPDDELLEMEGIKYALWLNPLRASLFFADHVLLVEGPSESALIEYLCAEGKLQPPGEGVVVIDTLGNYNIHRFMNLLSALRVPHAVLFDRDGDKPKAEVIGRFVNAAKTQYTMALDSFPDDLEHFLGIPEAGRPDRKPQHVMLQVRSGGLDAGRLAAFCEKIQALLGAFKTPALVGPVVGTKGEAQQ